ncbi:MAG TPA: hypothetical protein RMH26_08040 [Polyangiaceae bacterium LLY-WYZ-15_(1-7)]|nr:hypothetical protein [Polyangiaceae bacterium LLY-WYZ-15_(1-7)]
MSEHRSPQPHAPQPHAPEPSPKLDTADLLGTSMRIIGASFGPLLALALLCLLPAILFDTLLPIAVDALVPEAEPLDPQAPEVVLPAVLALGGLCGGVLLELILTYIAQGAMTYVLIELLAGRQAGVGASLGQAARRAGPLLLTSILSGVAVFLGALACLLPGLYISMVLFLVVPAVMMEDVGPVQALKRSAALTEGHRGTLFLAFLAVLLVNIVLACIITSFGVGMGGEVAGAYDATGQPQGPSALGLVVEGAISWAIAALQSMALAALGAVVYVRIRGIRERVNAQALAEVFA